MSYHNERVINENGYAPPTAAPSSSPDTPAKKKPTGGQAVAAEFRRRPVKAYLGILIVVELMVLAKFVLGGRTAAQSNNWFTEGYNSVDALPRAVFVAHFAALIHCRIMLLCYQNSPTIAFYAALVHVFEVFHFHRLSATLDRPWTSEHRVVLTIIYANAAYFTLHFLHTLYSYASEHYALPGWGLVSGADDYNGARFVDQTQRRWARVVSIGWSFLSSWSYLVPAMALLVDQRTPADVRPREWGVFTGNEAGQVLGAVYFIIAASYALCGFFSFGSRPCAWQVILAQVILVVPLLCASESRTFVELVKVASYIYLVSWGNWLVPSWKR